MQHTIPGTQYDGCCDIQLHTHEEVGSLRNATKSTHQQDLELLALTAQARHLPVASSIAPFPNHGSYQSRHIHSATSFGGNYHARITKSTNKAFVPSPLGYSIRENNQQKSASPSPNITSSTSNSCHRLYTAAQSLGQSSQYFVADISSSHDRSRQVEYRQQHPFHGSPLPGLDPLQVHYKQQITTSGNVQLKTGLPPKSSFFTPKSSLIYHKNQPFQQTKYNSPKSNPAAQQTKVYGSTQHTISQAYYRQVNLDSYPNFGQRVSHIPIRDNHLRLVDGAFQMDHSDHDIHSRATSSTACSDTDLPLPIHDSDFYRDRIAGSTSSHKPSPSVS
jgi:hypothetical protein